MLLKRSIYSLYCLHEETSGDDSSEQQIFAFTALTADPRLWNYRNFKVFISSQPIDG